MRIILHSTDRRAGVLLSLNIKSYDLEEVSLFVPQFLHMKDEKLHWAV